VNAGRGKGHIPDKHPTAPGFDKFAASVPSMQCVNIDMTKHCDKLRDQLRTSCCVGFAFSRGLDIRSRIMGLGNPYPSPMFTYAVARLQDGGGVLEDVGCIPGLAANGLLNYGIVSETRYPFDPSKINHHVPWDVIRSGADAQVHGAFRLTGMGLDRIRQIDAALEAGYPVVYGQNVDDAFEQWRGGDAYDGPRGPSRGSHMQCLLYEPGLPAKERRGVGSWSDFGEGAAFYRVTEGFLASQYATDFYILTLAPELE